MTFDNTVAATSSTVVGGGTGYTIGNLLTALGGTGTAAEFTIATLKAASAPVIAGGSGYTTGNLLSISGGAGMASVLAVNTLRAASVSVVAGGTNYGIGNVLIASGGPVVPARVRRSTSAIHRDTLPTNLPRCPEDGRAPGRSPGTEGRLTSA